MKKIIVFISLLMAAMILLSSCSNSSKPNEPENNEDGNVGDNNTHQHEPGITKIINEIKATCTTAGSYDEVIYCSNNNCNGIYSITTIIVHPLDHDYVNGVCARCSEQEPITPPDPGNGEYSEGLEYTLSEDGTYYIVSGIGTCTDTEIVIPNNYNNLPVQAIGSEAFADCTMLTYIAIPENIVDLGYHSFYGCTSLNKIYYNGSVSTECIMEDSFANVGSDCEFRIGTNVTIIPYMMFYCSGIKYLTFDIGSNCSIIEAWAFQNSWDMVSVVIPRSMTNINQGAFNWCTSLNFVYYEGSADEWLKINIVNDSYSTEFNNAALYYYSETQPTTEGNFWHYVDGVPTVWDAYNGGAHQHTFGEWDEVINTTETCLCEYEPVYIRTCSSCGEMEMMTYPAQGHRFSNFEPVVNPSVPACQWVPTYVAICDICGHYECSYIRTEGEAPGHMYVDGFCYYCGEANPNENPGDSEYSRGLAFTLSDDETYYIVSGIGSCTDTEIYIPPTYNNLPVKAIGENAFKDCTQITKVVIPDGVTRIGAVGGGAAMSFRGCTNLETVVIPDSVSYIGATAGESAFYNCNKLWTYENGVYYVNNWAITYNDWCITSSSYSEATSTLLVIREGTIGIGNQAFIFGEYTEVVIPSSVKYVCQVAFMNWTYVERIYYTGTPDQWATIQIDQFNDGLTNHPVYYYSETQPTTDGNFWRYVDGVPTVWPEYVAPTYSQGLEYEIIDDKTCAVVGIGTCTDANIVIPSVAPDGRTVVSIGTESNNSGLSFDKIISIFIPDTVTEIYGWTVIGCQELRCITVDENNNYFKSIDGNLYTNDGKTLIRYAHKGETEFVIPYGITTIVSFAFYNMGNNVLKSVSIPDTVTSIGKWAFAYCARLEHIEIPSNVTEIKAEAFYMCIDLSYVVIPKSLTYLDCSIFNQCQNLNTIYYTGTESDWQQMSISNFEWINNEYMSCKIFYYSETQPTEAGNFWRYVDGVPTVWPEYVAPTYSQGLEYEIIDDKTCAVVGIGTCTDANIVIPSVAPDGRTVVSIGTESNNSGLSFDKIISIFIPDTVTEIYGWTVIGCQELRCITVDENNNYFKSIDGNLYTNDGKTLIRYAHKGETEFVIPYGVTTIRSFAFYNMGNNVLESVSIPDTVTNIEGGAFAYCIGIKGFDFPDGMTTLNGGMFLCCRMEYIVIPKSVTCIDGPVQLLSDYEWKIYYKGTEAEWKDVEILNPNNYFSYITSAVVYYYSETQPTTDGNYWHYVDGVPTVW